MIFQIVSKQWNQSKRGPTLDLPFISIDFIMNLWELQYLKIDDHTNENLQTCVDEINSKIEEWIKSQAVFIFIYKKVIESNHEDLNTDVRPKHTPFDQKTIWKKNFYINYSKTFLKNNLKKPDRQFSESDRSFKSERSIQKVEIPWVEEWNFKFSSEYEAEINQILYFGYRDSLFYNKKENRWYHDYNLNSSNFEKKSINQSFANWTP